MSFQYHSIPICFILFIDDCCYFIAIGIWLIFEKYLMGVGPTLIVRPTRFMPTFF